MDVHRGAAALRVGAIMLALGLAGTALAWESISFDIPSGAKESLWRDALADRVGGLTEQQTPAGRVDVTTADEVFEIDWIRKWKEGMGQALAYAGATGKKPVLVLIAYSQGPAALTPPTRATLEQAEKECARHAVRLVVLFPTLPERPHPASSAGRP